MTELIIASFVYVLVLLLDPDCVSLLKYFTDHKLKWLLVNLKQLRYHVSHCLKLPDCF